MHLQQAARFVMEAKRVSDVKETHDRLLAIEGYYRARDRSNDLLGQVQEIRLLAEAKMGKLLARLERSRGGRPAPEVLETRPESGRVSSEYHEALQQSGLRRQQANEFMDLAELPEETIRTAAQEAASEGRSVSARTILEAHKPKKERVRKDVMQAVRWIETNFELEEVVRIHDELGRWLKREFKRQ
jgi:hypothetical protein